MKASIFVIRPFHSSLTAHTLRELGVSVSIFSSAPSRFFRDLDPDVRLHLIPSAGDILNRISPLKLGREGMMKNAVVWDMLASYFVDRSDIVIGYATQALFVGRRAKRNGNLFVLDRACPHVDTQQAMVREESDKVGARFTPEPPWYRDRQLEEYAIADKIVTPSRYTADSFPTTLKSKIVIAPLLGRLPSSAVEEPVRDSAAKFTLGVLGGHPLRKGYAYLLEAWGKLRLPNSILKIRSDGDFSEFPRLAELLSRTPNVEIVKYVPNIKEFYRSCDIFVLPSVDDGFGMALFEAMACGLPTIATRNCGASELLTDGRDAMIVEPRSVEDLERAILHMYKEPEFRRSIGERGRLRVAEIAQESIYKEKLGDGLLNVKT